jgi:hypothetical protein
MNAALNGDLANAIVASTPGGIERQEAQGQQDLVKAADRLPSNMSVEDQAALVQLGFIFGDTIDDIFRSVQMPAGWTIKPSDHSMHSDLIDPQGNKRGGIFYKAAFYDRKAHFNLNCRYYVSQDYAQPTSTHFIEDAKTGQRAHVVGTAPYADWNAGDAMSKQACKWLESNFPDYRDPLAYWDN